MVTHKPSTAQLRNQILKELQELPDELLTQTLDFVTFLKTKQGQSVQESSKGLANK